MLYDTNKEDAHNSNYEQTPPHGRCDGPHVVDIEQRKNQSPASTNTWRSNRDQYFQPMGSKENEKGARDTHK